MNFRTHLKILRDNKSKILVVGLGISGLAAANFLAKADLKVVAIEREERKKYDAKSKLSAHISGLESLGVECNFGVDGEDTAKYLEGVKLCVLSPGVSLESPSVAAILRNKIQIVSELELGIELKGSPLIALTGSNGKTTTVSIIHEMLRASGRKSVLCGNVGTPVVADLSPGILDSTEPLDDVQVVEASSYQLETCTTLKPKVALLLNISDNHLERHGNLERYLQCKARIFANQDSNDVAVINLDDERVSSLIPKLKAKLLGFTLDLNKFEKREGALISYDLANGLDLITVRINNKLQKFDLKAAKLLGLHNRHNMAAAVLAALAFGASAEAIQKVLDTFKTLEHRLELVPSESCLIINDSKSTTVASSVAAFKAITQTYPKKKITLMLGGLSKAGSWEPLIKLLSQNQDRLRPVVLFGKDGRILASHCASAEIACSVQPKVKEALQFALSQSAEEDIVLFSPGCASFDEFQDFEERGAYFKKLIAQRSL